MLGSLEDQISVNSVLAAMNVFVLDLVSGRIVRRFLGGWSGLKAARAMGELSGGEKGFLLLIRL